MPPPAGLLIGTVRVALNTECLRQQAFGSASVADAQIFAAVHYYFPLEIEEGGQHWAGGDLG